MKTNGGLRRKSGSQSEDTEDEERQFGGAGARLNSQDEDWLTETLPNLTHFAAILPRVYPLILRACLVETNLRCLQKYIDFLTQHPPHEKLYQSAVEMSRVMVDRFETVQKLFSTSSESSIVSSTDGMNTLGSLLSMLRNALQSALHSQTVPEISSSTDFILVNFPVTSEKVIIHVALVEAIFLFLSCDLSAKSNPVDFKYFLEMWFPNRSKNKVEAFTVETKEPVSLPSSSIVPQMLFSTNPKILDTMIQRATPVQLCTFVQQFGCPCESVDKVLEKLDSFCDEQGTSITLRRSIDSPVMLASCVEVQFFRGVKSGRVFLSCLQGLANLPPTEIATDISAILEQTLESSTEVKSHPITKTLTCHTVLPANLGKIPQEKMEQQLLQIFAPSLSRVSASVGEVQKVTKELEEALKALILATRKPLSSGSGKSFKPQQSLNVHISGLIAALHKLVSGSSIRRQFLEGVVKHRFSLLLFRLLTKIQCMNQIEDISASLFKTTVQQILGLLEGKKVTCVTGLSLFHTVLTSCAKQLGIKKDSKLKSSSAKELTSLAKNACIELRAQQDPFEKETVLVKTITNVIQNGPSSMVEDILSVVAQRSIYLGMEAKCISFIHKIKMATSVKPLALQCFPELFVKRVAESTDTAHFQLDTGKENDDQRVDLCGLFVDWLETLDPGVSAWYVTAVY